MRPIYGLVLLVAVLVMVAAPVNLLHAEQELPEPAISPLDFNTFVDIIPDSLTTKTIDYFEEGWSDRYFDMSHWDNVVFLPQVYGGEHFLSPCIYNPDIYAYEAYFRSVVNGLEAENQIRGVFVKIVTDNDFDFYVNGTFVGSEYNGQVGPLKVYNVTPYWEGMENVLAVKVTNPQGPGSLYITTRVYYRP